MLKTRIVTAFLFSAFLVYLLSFSPASVFPHLFATFVALCVVLSGAEFAAMRWNVMDGPVAVQQHRPTLVPKHFLMGFSYGAKVLLFYICYYYLKWTYEKSILLVMAWFFVCMLIASALIYRTAEDMHKASNKLLNYIAGFLYLSFPSICFLELASMPLAEAVRSAGIYFCLFVTFAGDTGCYFIGIKFGKHKLIPKVSPKKTIEGAYGGVVFSALAALLGVYLFHLPFPSWFCLLVGIVTGIAAQIGDLIESAFKRAGGYKDSGNLLPGHGGFLDRIDSAILGIPVTYILFSLYQK